jgi:hypothetical protein
MAIGRTLQARGINIGNGLPTAQSHNPVYFGPVNFENLSNAILSGNRKAPKLRATNKTGCRAQCPRPHNVRTAPNTAVQQYRDTTRNRLYHSWQSIYCCWRSIQLPTAMVGNDYGVGTPFDCLYRVQGVEHAFNYELTRPISSDVVKITPTNVRI